MPRSFSQIALSTIAAAVLLNGAAAYAADNAAAAAQGSFATASQDAAPVPATVVAANHRETNLRTTATTIVVLGMDDGKSGSKHR